MPMSLRRLLFGDALPTAHEVYHRLTKVQALAVFSSDALSSVAYATEEILLVLVLAGSSALGLSVPIALVIAVLLVIVGTSYYQTIHGYPSGGGAYIVAHDNLGVWPGLIAAGALLIDYVLTVAVSVTAGVAAVTSAFPVLLPFRVLLCLLAIALIAWANLRGVRESGRLFSIPTYGFVCILLTLIVVGLARAITGGLAPVPSQIPKSTVGGGEVLMAFLVLRAFASGCTALTGIEAISNGIPAFQKPEADNAGKTLLAMVALLTTMFLGITVLAHISRVSPTEAETVVSQVGRLVFGSGPLYLALQAGTALILILAANTSFADFPRLSSILARDRYVPRQLANLGDRLVFNNGIIALALLASTLVVVFGGQTHRLIPLYAVGVFLAFTLSQAGMVLHWRKEGGARWRLKAAVNGLGAVATGVVLTVIVGSKLIYGAWIVALLIPVSGWFFHTVRRHYESVAEQLSLDGLVPERWTGLASRRRHKVVVPVSGMHRGTLAALRFARSLSKDVTAVVVDVEPGVTSRVRKKWPSWGHDVPLIVLKSPYRSTLGPLLEYLEEVDQREPKRGLGVVVLPEFVTATWWQNFLHNQTAQLIKKALVYRRGQAAKDRVIIDVPYHLWH
ncbi:MAG: amino acid permease [Anaerolineae bacterium]|nr:amino acid permease [Anaerolineae bacterium]NIN95824.1 amino acid permease [Anaerolineae bacterium]NIQ78790.1 amino acid permease [Anaerolineae bacterium]